MLRRILIGLDGSEYCWAAVEMAIGWAKAASAQLTGLGVVDEPEICAPEPVPLGASAFKAQLDQSRLAEARSTVESAVQRFEQMCRQQGIPAQALVDVGLPSQQIAREAQRADLIFLGQQTRFALDEEPGRTLHALLKAPPRPVVVVPREVPQQQAVLVAYDGSLQATRALWAYCQLGLARFLGNTFVLTVHEDEAQGRLISQYAVDLLGSHSIASSTQVLSPRESVDRMILQVAQECQAGLIVMGCYGKASLMEWFLGTTTVNTIAHTPVPLFLFQ